MKKLSLAKTKAPLLLVLLLFMCKDVSLVSPKKSTNSVDRIAESKSFEQTLYQTKKFYRPAILELLYTTSEKELNQILTRKSEIVSKGDKITEADVLTVFNYPNRELFIRNARLLSIAFEKFFTEFPELKKLPEQDLRLILSQSINKYKENYWTKNSKRDGNLGGRVQTCSSDHTACLNAAQSDYYINTALCAAGAIVGGIVGIVAANPLIVAGAFAFGEGCLISAAVISNKHMSICTSNFTACMAANSNDETGTNPYYLIPYFNPKVILHNLTYYYDATFWLEIPQPPPPPPVDENGCFYNSSGDLICY